MLAGRLTGACCPASCQMYFLAAMPLQLNWHAQYIRRCIQSLLRRYSSCRHMSDSRVFLLCAGIIHTYSSNVHEPHCLWVATKKLPQS